MLSLSCTETVVRGDLDLKRKLHRALGIVMITVKLGFATLLNESFDSIRMMLSIVCEPLQEQQLIS